MPLDYSKWDALELSDDSDIEVHPNVDKRSFIRAKQNQIHQQRQQRKLQIETFKYERIINEALIARIEALLNALRNYAGEAQSEGRNPGEVAFRAVMESAAAATSTKDGDNPPPRPAGVHGAEEPMPTYTKMLATLLDQVNKALDERKVGTEKRYGAMVEEIGEHLHKVKGLQKELEVKLAELEKEERSKITSESIHTGFDSSQVNKAKSTAEPVPAKDSSVELLKPGTASVSSSTTKKPSSDQPTDLTVNDDDVEISASPLAREFAKIKASELRQSASFLASHPNFLSEREHDGLMMLAFDSAIEGREDEARNYVHQALLLQYCQKLRDEAGGIGLGAAGDAVGMFFKRITSPGGHKAQDMFYQDVQSTYGRILTRAREMRAGTGVEGEEVEQIQLHAVDKGTVINITVPPAGSDDPEVQQARKVFEGFKPELRRALESGSLDEVNKVLGRLKVPEAEEVVGLLGEVNILAIEELIDATTDEGREQLKRLEEEKDTENAAAAAQVEDQGPGSARTQCVDDPE